MSNGLDQFQPAHRDGYGDHLASAIERAGKGFALNAAEANALVREVERLRASVERVRALPRWDTYYGSGQVGSEPAVDGEWFDAFDVLDALEPL